MDWFSFKYPINEDGHIAKIVRIYFPSVMTFMYCNNITRMKWQNFVIWGFRREVAENCRLLDCYAANSAHFVLTRPLKMGPIRCPETWVRNYNYSLRNIPKERGSQETKLVLIACYTVLVYTKHWSFVLNVLQCQFISTLITVNQIVFGKYFMLLPFTVPSPLTLY